MTSRKSSEFARIERIAKVLSEDPPASAGAVLVGIGDDAAVLSAAAGRLVWTIDSQVERVHFDRRWVTLDSIGYRSFQAALSDLAAMGARPIAALANLTLPDGFRDRELEKLVQGQAAAARECGCPLSGGNLSRGGELSVTTTALGCVKEPLLRGGARPGDELWLVGEVGMAALGLQALQEGRPKTASVRRCIESWQRPRARLAEGRKLIGRARAALDVSDGLSGDAWHLATASGVQVVVRQTLLARTFSKDLVRASAELGVDPLAFALSGGEDYALLAAGPPGRRIRQARVIGTIERGQGVVLEGATGKRRALGPSYDHFRRTRPSRRA